MDYISTRGEAAKASFEDVLLAGLARDGGLYVPECWPQMSHAEIGSLAGKPFSEVAVEIIGRFAGNAFLAGELGAMVRSVYAPPAFSHPAITPLVQLDADTWVLELFHGPTLAFKDVAMQLLARMMDQVLAKRGQRAMIVGATSGDTGGAAIEAFRGVETVDVVILFPDGRVSDVQRRMMTTPFEDNVHAVAIKGTFDDCQALVKGMFNDHAFRDRVSLSAINSINWGRIVAQVPYYFAAAVALGAPHRKISFVVPTGNFGDIFAGYAAKRMGLPVDRLVIASNANDILPRTLSTGVYEVRPVEATTSPSMDIGVSSNFERYLFEASGRDSALIRSYMASLKQSGRFELGGGVAQTFGLEFDATSASQEVVAQEIAHWRAAAGYMADPHTACGLAARDGGWERFQRQTPMKARNAKGESIDVPPLRGKSGQSQPPMVFLSTASPAKFPDTMQAITGERPALPARLSRLMSDPERFDVLANDLAQVQAYVAKRARSLQEGAT